MAKVVSKVLPIPVEYKIVDPKIKPDGLGQLGGVKVYVRGSDRYVRMTPRQAKYFLEHRAIALVGAAATTAAAKSAAPAAAAAPKAAE